MTIPGKVPIPKGGPKGVWVIYLAALAAAVVLLGDAFDVVALQKISAGLGLALIVSVLSLFATAGRPIGWTAVVIVWLGVVASWVW